MKFFESLEKVLVFGASVFFFLVGNFFIFSNIFILTFSKSKIVDVKNLKKTEYAIVFGASVRGESVSPILFDRLKKTAEVFEENKIEKILVSGFKNSVDFYDEPEVMKNVLIQNFGISKNKILKDEFGSRTFATCNRAKNFFKIEKAVLVTQEFHLARSIFLCEIFGISSVGVVAEDNYSDIDDETREFFARGMAVKDVLFYKLKIDF
ncbi:MAG: ElyC/SanA/YdcF family protein [Patescibacteria group bacterium]